MLFYFQHLCFSPQLLLNVSDKPIKSWVLFYHELI